DRGREFEADADVAERVVCGVADRALELHRQGCPLDRQLAVHLDAVAVPANVGGAEGDLRCALCVEELRRLQVRGEVLVQHLDAGVRLLRSHAALRRILSTQLSADHGLTINEYEALLRLSRAEEGAMRRIDLAGELLLTPSGVTRLLDGLERGGYVEKGVCDS